MTKNILVCIKCDKINGSYTDVTKGYLRTYARAAKKNCAWAAVAMMRKHQLH